MMNKNYILSIFVCVLAISVVKSQSNRCDLIEKDFDKRLKELFWIGENPQIPRKIEEIDAFCSKTGDLIKDTAKFKGCLGPFPKLIINIILRQIKSIKQKICTNKQHKLETLTRLKCLNNTNIVMLYECGHQAFLKLNYIADHLQDTEIVPGFCCIFHQVTQCSVQKVKILRESCPTQVKSESSVLNSLLSGLSGEATELICSRIESLASCKRDYNGIMKQLQTVSHRNKTPLEKIPLVQPLLKIASKLASKD